MTIRILIADDHDVVRQGLRTILESHPGWKVVAEAGDGKDAIKMALQTKPDVAVLDYSMPLINGVEATRQIRERLPKTEILIFSNYAEEVLITELLRAGARAYVLKTDLQYNLTSAVEALGSHRPFFTSKVSEALLDAFVARSIEEKSTLHDEERSIVQFIAEGYTNKEIGIALNLSLQTVETRRAVASAQARSRHPCRRGFQLQGLPLSLLASQSRPCIRRRSRAQT
jgi:DNA-binding NarL/FixJ family response regulator